MLDFKFSFRIFRFIYIAFLALIVFLLTENLWATLVCLLAAIDIVIDKDVFVSFSDGSTDSNDDERFGPNT